MSLTNSPSWMYNPSTGFYNGVATQSLRIDEPSNANLSWTPSSAGNRKKWTFSTWIKRSALESAGDKYIFGVSTGSNNNDSFMVLLLRADSIGCTCISLEVLKSTKLLRDTSAWYHVLWVLDTANATPSNRMRIYVNGDEITSWLVDNRSNSVLNDTNMPVLNTQKHHIGRHNSNTTSNYNGYLAYTELVEGEALTPSDFTEVKNGVLIPKAYTGDHGTYGFRLEYKETGDGSVTASSTTIGADTKSNATKQHWNDNNLDSYDSNMPDCPELNFCTLSPLHLPSNINNQILEGGLVADATSSSWSQIPAGWAFQAGEKWYWEACASNTAYYLGVASPNVVRQSANALIGWDNPLREAWIYHNAGLIRYNGANQASVGSISANDIIAFAVDVDGGTLRFYKNNVLQYTASHDFTGWFPDCATINTVYMGYNFGQDSTFSGIKSTGSANATDENGYGDFYYTPPSGYLAMCSANLSTAEAVDPAEDNSPTDYFNARTYNGNGTGQSITGVNFQPDWTWIKRRSASERHLLTDSVRGVTKLLFSTHTDNEATRTDQIQSFDADGFTLGNDGAGYTNINGQTYVAWNWKAGGTASSNTNGSITSSVSANQDVGFSIVTYTGNGSSGATIGHGLSQAPDMIITKFRQGGSPGSGWLWPVFHKDVGTGGYLRLNATNGTTSNSETVKAVGTSTYTIGSDGHINQSSGNFVAYVFHEVAGFSKFGTYFGNGSSSNGAFVYTGFRPAFIMYKKTSASGNWLMDDNKTQTFNPDSNYLLANSTDPEGDTGTNTAGHAFDMLSNGFKFRNTNTERNGNGNTFIYMAFAEQPFKYANAR